VAVRPRGSTGATRADAFAAYRSELEREFRAGLSTEHTHRPALKSLIEQLASVTATNEPKRSECGAPDLSVWEATGHGPLTIGYVEAKDVDVPLNAVERGEQMGRYLPALENLILTDYLEFRWYVGGEHRLTARLATKEADGSLTPVTGGQEAVATLLAAFLTQQPGEIRDPKELAERMARLTHLVRDVIVQTFAEGAQTETTRSLRAAFTEVLIPDLSVSDFADMFSQTIAYGLFAARANHESPEPFRRQDAAVEIPRTNPFLRKLFATITGPDLDDEPFAGLVDDLAQLLGHTDMSAVLADFGTRTRQEDPVVHFYETFLAAYDPELREMRGVYYTPAPVVSYIVRSIDHLLKTRFGCREGLADRTTVTYERTTDDGESTEATVPRVLILDPACGTGTFLYAVVNHIREQFIARNDAGRWSGYVRDQLLPRLLGFELLMAPYAVAHLKLGMQLAAQDLPEDQREDWTYDFEGGERLGVYLTNTLAQMVRRSELLLGAYISEEANAAAEIKREMPIFVVLGNPPYSGQSANASWREEIDPRNRRRRRRVHTWIGERMNDYYFVDGAPLGERNPKWIQDDYVKFLRFGQWRIEETGAGVLGFITNHAYLDNPTFRGMRQQLMETFTDIYILDVHGNQKRKEKASDGRADRNVFDIQQGVAIALFVKEPGHDGPGHVHHADLRGSVREEKYDWLGEHDLETTEWAALEPESPDYFFKPVDFDRKTEYELGFSIDEAMPLHNAGFVSARDALVIDYDEATLRARILDFLNPENSDQRVRTRYFGTKRHGDREPGDSSDWNLAEKRKAIRADGDRDSAFATCLYRPFDERPIFYHPDALDRPRRDLMRNLLAGENIALISARSNRSPTPDHFFCSRLIVEAKTGESTTQCYAFPLYVYPETEETITLNLLEDEGQAWPAGMDGRRPNLSPDFVAAMTERLGLEFVPDGAGDLASTFGPEDVFAYSYAVFHSPIYRSRYAEFLKTHFPRVPVASDADLFCLLVAKGNELIAVHTLESSSLERLTIHYPVRGDDVVESMPRYLAPGDPDPSTGEALESGRVYISKTDRRTGKQGQYAEGVPPDVWEFTVGGYQICEKWLKDRRGRKLTDADLTLYGKIIVAISETIRLMDEIDAEIEGWPIH
jgi:hypothetical protein